MVELPTGTVTFLFTDIEGSTARWERHPDAMRVALARHDEILEAAIDGHGGVVFSRMGDGMAAAFASARQAVGAAVAAQRGLAGEAWPEPLEEVRSRMGVHTGEGLVVEGQYLNQPLNRCARLMAIGHGGQVLVSGSTEPLVRGGLPEGVGLVDLGDHRLRDLSEPIRVFQVEDPAVRRTFSALRSLNAVPGNLPLQLTSFVGREDEVASLSVLVRESRIVTLIGVGGVGKTRLALQVAGEIGGVFRDGVWLCELATANDSGSMLAVVGDVVGARPRDGMSMTDSIVGSLCERELLLVLDNCEHLLGDAANLVAAIARRSANVHVLATSREGLGVGGERLVAVQTLAVPAATEEHKQVAQSAAVLLFADRAGAARTTFALSDANIGAVADICRRLDGMPLAIELAAARVSAMSPADISAHLDERFRLLTGGRQNRVERHQTLRATLDWSFSLLSPFEQTVLNRLSVFVGSFTARAAQAVVADTDIGAWDVLEILTSLVGKSMVVAEDLDETTTRYRLLETVRAFAREHLDGTDDSDIWRRRHAEYYAELCEIGGVGLAGPDSLAWSMRLTAELDNIRAVLGWSADAPEQDDADRGLRIFIALTTSSVQSRWGLQEWSNPLLPRARTSLLPRRTAVFAAAAHWHMMSERTTEAESLAREALEVTSDDDPVGGLWAHSILAALRFREGRLREALELIDEGNRRFAGPVASVTRSYSWMIDVFAHMGLGEIEVAREHAGGFLALARRERAPDAEVVALTVVGLTWVSQAPARALSAFGEAIALMRGGAFDTNYTIALAGAAQARARLGDREQALRDLREAVAFDHASGQAGMLAMTVERAVAVLAALGEDELAAMCLAIARAGTISTTRVLPAADRVAARLIERLGAGRFDAAVTRGSRLRSEEIGPTLLSALDARLEPAEVLPRQ